MSAGRLLQSRVGLSTAALGVLILAANRLNLPLSRLPGDIVWRGKHSAVYFPWVTCLLLSIAGTFILWLLNRRS